MALQTSNTVFSYDYTADSLLQTNIYVFKVVHSTGNFNLYANNNNFTLDTRVKYPFSWA
jgi:hypothetical protein